MHVQAPNACCSRNLQKAALFSCKLPYAHIQNVGPILAATDGMSHATMQSLTCISILAQWTASRDLQSDWIAVTEWTSLHSLFVHLRILPREELLPSTVICKQHQASSTSFICLIVNHTQPQKSYIPFKMTALIMCGGQHYAGNTATLTTCLTANV